MQKYTKNVQKIYKKLVKLRTKIGQNWVKVSSWASLDGLAVLSMSDIVYTVVYTVLYIEKYTKNIQKYREVIDQNLSKLGQGELLSASG